MDIFVYKFHLESIIGALNMRIGIIGLGDIAQKAYLPVLSEKEGIEIVLCTRNLGILDKLSKKYRIHETVQTIEELINKKIDAAFINAATEAHVEIAEKLIKSGINVYIDKPIALELDKTKGLVKLAQKSGKVVMVGFNRRFAPMYNKLKSHGGAEIIIMQKNRFSLPGETRGFINDDFIHVVDTLRYLMDSEVKEVKVQYLKKNNLLYNVIIQLIGDKCTAMGIMNRNNGVTEEIVEYMAEDNKYVVEDLVKLTHYNNKNMNISKFDDWKPTLYKRGFYQIIDHFLECVQNNKMPEPSIEDSLITHEICERIIEKVIL